MAIEVELGKSGIMLGKDPRQGVSYREPPPGPRPSIQPLAALLPSGVTVQAHVTAQALAALNYSDQR